MTHLADVRLDRAAQLQKALEDVRGSRPAAARVLAIADDPNADARALAAAIEVDPMLTAQILRLANSAAFGMRSRVGNTQLAVSVIGFSAVRSIATLLAAGLRHGRTAAPKDFWRHSAATAAACAVVADRFGMGRGDAFSLGLLHDIGAAILYGVDPVAYSVAADPLSDSPAQCTAEIIEFGMSHADAGATVLGAWNFPPEIVAAIADHHSTLLGASVAGRVLLAGDALAHLVVEPNGYPGDDPDKLESLGIDSPALGRITALVLEHMTDVLAALPT